jgi:hypothetical protein
MLNVPAPTRIPLATLQVGGKTVEVFLSPEWARYFQSLNTQVTESAATLATALGMTLITEVDGGQEDQLAPGYDFSHGAYAGGFSSLTYSAALAGSTGTIKIGDAQFYNDAPGAAGIQFYKDAAGKVGIGIVPTAAFEVFSAGAEYSVKWSKTGSNKWALGSYAGGAYLVNDTTGAKHLQFTDAGLTLICGGGAAAIYVDALQRVGIGAVSSGAALYVAGGVNATSGYASNGAAGITATVTGADGLSITISGGVVTGGHSGTPGITGTMTSASLTGKTLTFTNGLITGFA